MQTALKTLLPLLLLVVLFSSHDMYLKLDGYFLEPDTPATIKLFNGTFDKSDNVITRDRMLDVSIVGVGERTRIDTTAWTEEDAVTLLNFTTGAPGTWVAGVSTASRDFAQTAEAFTSYLKHDGVLDVLEERERTNTSDQDVIERYSKHVKTIFQVGEQTSDDWKTELGYPIEFIPLGNPYALQPGDVLPVRLLWRGEPLANQIVYVAAASAPHTHADGEEHEHDAEEDHTHTAGTMLRTDTNGNLLVELTSDGTWYLRTIYLVESPEPEITHESNWATLTFSVPHGHAHTGDGHTHADGSNHSHDHGDGNAHSHEGEHQHDEPGVPAYVYWLGSLAIITGLFFYFNRKEPA